MTHSLPIGAILLMSRTHSPNIGMSERMYARTHVRMYVYVCACVRRVYGIGSTILMSSSCDSVPSQMAWRPSLTLAGREVVATCYGVTNVT